VCGNKKKKIKIKKMVCDSVKKNSTKNIYTFFFILSLENNARTPDTKNSTQADHNEDVTGI